MDGKESQLRVMRLEKAVTLQKQQLDKISKSFESMARLLKETLFVQHENTERVKELQTMIAAYLAKIEALESRLSGQKPN